MLEPELTIGFFTTRSYTLLIAVAILLSMMTVLYRLPSEEWAKYIDILIAGLVGGIFVARIVHVALNWTHFAYHTEEVLQISAGGLDWHGALIGSLLAMRWMAQRQSISFEQLLDSMTIAIPLIAFAAWWGCMASRCSYGAEVANLTDYPSWMVWEAPDVFNIYAPRFSTQTLGMIASGTLFMMTILFIWRGWLAARRFWLVLALLSIMMFGLGFCGEIMLFL